MPAVNIVDRFQAIQYTGSNSAEIDATITYFSVTSEAAGVLEFDSAGVPFTMNTGDWIRFTQGFVQSVHTDGAFENFFVRNAVSSDLAEFAGGGDLEEIGDRLDALENLNPILSSGVGPVPALLLNGSAVVTVTLDPAMDDSDYTTHVRLLGTPTLLGNLSITAVSIVDQDTVSVTVQNAGLASGAGATVLVTVTA